MLAPDWRLRNYADVGCLLHSAASDGSESILAYGVANKVEVPNHIAAVILGFRHAPFSPGRFLHHLDDRVHRRI
jgi:hypothetical protein